MTSTLAQPEHNVDFEHQKQLAKLLAKENIRVRMGNYPTAFFDVKNRVLGLPAWNIDNKAVSDLLVGHEVGHAHWTPEDGIAQYHDRFGKQAPFDIANVVEDIRIERKILSLFPGLVSSFTKGYGYLLEKDFFKLEGQNINELSFLDRLNIKGKGRDLVDVEFDEWETSIYKKCLRAETYEEVLDICGEIIDNLPEEEPEKPNQNEEETQPEESQPSDDSDQDQDGGDDDSIDMGAKSLPEEESPNEGDWDSEEDDEDNSETSKSKKPSNNGEEEETENERGQNNSSGKDWDGAISNTQRALDAELENNQENFDGTVYADAPSRSQINECITDIEGLRKSRKEKLSLYNNIMTCPNEDLRWGEFKKTSKQNVALLVREFERKKSAYEYSRAQQSATGSIDPNKLHSYKYEDQIFKSVTKLAQSKDHGMIFFIDWSGSMNRVLHQVVQQALQLAFFCRAVGIPFEVYGFTTNRSWYGRHDNGKLEQVGTAVNLGGTSVFELLNSSISKRDFEEAAKELFVSTRVWRGGFDNDLESLGGTPLFGTILCAEEIVRKFRNKHRVQKLHTMFLTDGESNPLTYDVDEEAAKFEKPDRRENSAVWTPTKEYVRWGKATIGPDAFSHRGRHSTYRQLILNFKKVTGSSAICFFLGDPRHAKGAGINAITHSSKFKSTSWYEGTEEFKELRKRSVKDKSRTIFIEDGYGFDGYFIIETSKVKIEDLNLEMEEDLDYSKASDVNKLAKKFSTQNRDKRTSRVFLSKFSDLIS